MTPRATKAATIARPTATCQRCPARSPRRRARSIKRLIIGLSMGLLAPLAGLRRLAKRALAPLDDVLHALLGVLGPALGPVDAPLDPRGVLLDLLARAGEHVGDEQ